VKVPAYEMLRQDRGLGQHMLGALMRGVSTREYQEVLPQMAATVGLSRSAISRKVVEASIEQLQQLQERRWEDRFARLHLQDLRTFSYWGDACPDRDGEPVAGLAQRSGQVATQPLGH
jgi:hypothetical protein